MKRLLPLFVAGIVFAAILRSTLAAEPEIVSVAKIWDQGKHNAFTDLIRWHDKWWCTFREADDHVGGDGLLRVLVSDDGEKWEAAAGVKSQLARGLAQPPAGMESGIELTGAAAAAKTSSRNKVAHFEEDVEIEPEVDEPPRELEEPQDALPLETMEDLEPVQTEPDVE